MLLGLVSLLGLSPLEGHGLVGLVQSLLLLAVVRRWQGEERGWEGPEAAGGGFGAVGALGLGRCGWGGHSDADGGEVGFAASGEAVIAFGGREVVRWLRGPHLDDGWLGACCRRRRHYRRRRGCW